MIGFYFRESNARSQVCQAKLKGLLDERKIEYRDIVDESTFCSCDDIDLLIVFGGDGSVLRASKIGCGEKPIVAINTGNVGFLTSYEEDNIEQLVEDIVNHKLTFIKRRFMQVECDNITYYALNDAVIAKNYAKDPISECIKLSLKINDELVDKYVADGLILSTPTGSTAYAISAGGPIMAPNVNAFVAAPICAHSLHSRPIVYSADCTAVVKILPESKECALYIDGKLEHNILPNTHVKFNNSDKFVKICDNHGKFFSRLSEKLIKWTNNSFQEN